jgi:GNAT superfamily N-acetyltransferase
LETRELPRERFDEASVVMADAFLDDPGWIAVGPDDRRRRHAYTRRVCRATLAVTARWGGPTWCVEIDGRVAGVLSSFAPDDWPPPAVRATLIQAPGPLMCGPAVLRRSLQADAALHRGHPEEPHLFVWMLTVSPAHQRGGVGRALLSTAIQRAGELGVPAYLDTANPDNLPYYRSFGFELIGQGPMPRGATIWYMQRPVP